VSDEFAVRRYVVQAYETHEDAGRRTDRSQRKVVAAAVIKNPYAGRYVEDLSPAVAFSASLGETLGRMALDALGEPAQSYGKGGIVGVDGEQEHAVMFITTTFGDVIRRIIGGGKAWIPSATVVGAPGTPLVVPLAHKDALYVRENYDAVTLYPDDAPRPAEVVVAVALANRGRLNHRLGGLAPSEIVGEDGLR
jgi:hypothetical protein